MEAAVAQNCSSVLKTKGQLRAMAQQTRYTAWHTVEDRKNLHASN